MTRVGITDLRLKLTTDSLYNARVDLLTEYWWHFVRVMTWNHLAQKKSSTVWVFVTKTTWLGTWKIPTQVDLVDLTAATLRS